MHSWGRQILSLQALYPIGATLAKWLVDRFLPLRRGETEQPSLQRPIKRQVSLENSRARQFGRLSPVQNCCYNIRRKEIEADPPRKVARATTKFISKVCKRPVAIFFYQPLSPSSSVNEIDQAVIDLFCNAWVRRLDVEDWRSLSRVLSG